MKITVKTNIQKKERDKNHTIKIRKLQNCSFSNLLYVGYTFLPAGHAHRGWEKLGEKPPVFLVGLEISLWESICPLFWLK